MVLLLRFSLGTLALGRSFRKSGISWGWGRGRNLESSGTWDAEGGEKGRQLRVRGRSQEDPMPKGRWPRGATPCLRSGVAAGRSYPMSEVRGSSRECQAVTAQEQLRGATPRPRSGAEARRTPCPRKQKGW